MKRPTDFYAPAHREDAISDFATTFFLSFSTLPRMLLEVFIRKDFGERHFRLIPAIILALFLGVMPFINIKHLIAGGRAREVDVFGDWLGWYLFLVAFLALSFWHYRAIKKGPSVFDFARYSRSLGTINPLFYKIKIPGLKNDERTIATLIEPAFFLVAGLLLWLVGQKLGILLTVSAIFYGFGHMAAYRIGDYFVMDKIDQMIRNEVLQKAFVDDAPAGETNGYRYIGNKPDDKDMRRRILPLIKQADDAVEAR